MVDAFVEYECNLIVEITNTRQERVKAEGKVLGGRLLIVFHLIKSKKKLKHIDLKQGSKKNIKYMLQYSITNQKNKYTRE